MIIISLQNKTAIHKRFAGRENMSKNLLAKKSKTVSRK
jgi:hypothetical protein